MSEMEPSPEQNPQYTREHVLEGLRKLSEKGIKRPEDLSPSDPDAIEAERILDEWRAQSTRRAEESQDPFAKYLNNLEQITIFVDAGFSDPDYLDEVAKDWLAQDLQEAIDDGLPEVAAKIQAKIDEIEAKLVQREEKDSA